jgi:hypothetical protein
MGSGLLPDQSMGAQESDHPGGHAGKLAVGLSAPPGIAAEPFADVLAAQPVDGARRVGEQVDEEAVLADEVEPAAAFLVPGDGLGQSGDEVAQGPIRGTMAWS